MSRTVAKFVQIPFNATIMLAVIAWSGYVPTASGSALFDGTNADLWVIDPANGQITSYDYGQWLEQFTDANYPLSGNEEALINNAPNSSQTLSPG